MAFSSERIVGEERIKSFILTISSLIKLLQRLPFQMEGWGEKNLAEPHLSVLGKMKKFVFALLLELFAY